MLLPFYGATDQLGPRTPHCWDI